MNTGFNNHVSEEVLETYALGKLSDEDCAPLEEHLLLCCICQRRLERTDEYLRVIKAAASSLDHGPAAGIRRFVPEFRIPATIPGTALLFPHASDLANIGFGFTTLVALGRFCVNTAWTWNGTPRLG
jgi:anti-sigma factor RsiW